MKKTLVIALGILSLIALVPQGASAKSLMGLYNKRYCEILAVKMPEPSVFSVDVYTTAGLNECPLDQWNSLDLEQAKAETGALVAKKNGPRRWTIDGILGAKAEEPTTLAGLEIRKVAELGLTSLSPAPFTEVKVARTTTFVYKRGRTVHFLISPEGRKYAMQAYTTTLDPTLRAKNLGDLGTNPALGIPEGWTFKTIRLKKQLRLPANGEATVIRDALEGTYQKFKWPKDFFKPVKKKNKKKR